MVEVPPGDADGARPEERGSGTTRRAPASAARRATVMRPAATPRRRPSPARAAGNGARRAGAPEPVELSQGALDRLKVELDELTRVKRREVVARIKAAREHGDLKENAEYHAAREEQSFLEGRVQALEDRLRRAVVVEQEGATGRVMHRVEGHGRDRGRGAALHDRRQRRGGSRRRPAEQRVTGRCGAAGRHRRGQEVEIRTPRGSVRYRVVSVD